MAEISLDDRAYCKIILHAAKYPHSAVNGVLLVEKPKTKDVKSVKFIDTIPFFHLTLTLAPMMEIALLQVDAYCKAKGLMIGGYYQVNEHEDNQSPTAISYKIADKIHDYFSEACIVMLRNNSLSIECEDEVCDVYTCHDNKWSLHKDPKGYVDSETLASTAALLQARAYKELVDFDCHLDNICKDWTNPHINEMIEHST